jgi:hypothetical protein
MELFIHVIPAKAGIGVTNDITRRVYEHKNDLIKGFTEKYKVTESLMQLIHERTKFFLYIRKYLNVMTQLLEHDLPTSYVMQAIKGPLVIDLAARTNPASK